MLLDILDAAIAAADPYAAVARSLRQTPAGLDIGGHGFDVPSGRVIVLALGKAAEAMATAAVAALEGIPITGVVAAPSLVQVAPLSGVIGSHPVPDGRSLEAGRALLDAAAQAGPDDLVLCLISGGGSALAEVPAPGVDIGDIASTTNALLRAGAPIEELNTVRRSLSVLKDGGLARAAGEARVAALIVSDVVGSPLHVIAGGPTASGPTSCADAAAVLEHRNVIVRPSVARHFKRGRDASHPERTGDIAVIVADGPSAAHAAARRAADLGLGVTVLDDPVEGEAREVGRLLVGMATDQPSMLIGSGETTVTVGGDGVGGRNQEVAISAAIEVDGVDDLVVCSLGTDGIDGPTDAAGAIADGGTIGRGREAGLEAAAALARNDALPYLEATGDLLRCGPTGTNVGDLFFVWRTA
ncbi:DUF4147 domain-containing protein [bacterium]|nr:DUF4147 domain-containing protein [bacterium]